MNEEAFVGMRTKRDATLAMPTLILPSIQVNIRAGELPPPEDNGGELPQASIERLLARRAGRRRVYNFPGRAVRPGDI